MIPDIVDLSKYFTIFDPSFIGYNSDSILELCNRYTKEDQWDIIYPGVNLDSKRYSEDFLQTDARLIIDAFKPEMNITYKNAQIFRMKPNEKGLMHRDTDRQCGILFPITPRGNDFAPVRFHDENLMPFIRANYAGKAIVLNVLENHSILNNEHERINFQIDIHMPYAEFISLLREGKVFK